MTFRLYQVPFVLSGVVIMFVLAACGGGSGGGLQSADSENVPTIVTPSIPFPLPQGHNLSAGEITVAPGGSEEQGNVVVSCPAGGSACVVTVAIDGTASYDRTGGVPGVEAKLRITTLFGNTKQDHYPLNAKFSRIADQPDPYCCWNMEEEESDIASRGKVFAMLEGNIFNSSVSNAPGLTVQAEPPVLRFAHGTEPDARAATVRAIDNINAWLPWEKHITVGNDLSTEETELHAEGRFHIVHGRTSENIMGANLDDDRSAAPGAANLYGIFIRRDANTNIHVIQHELLHAMGIGSTPACATKFGEDCWNVNAAHYHYYNHVPVSEFPESSMAYASPYDDTHGLSQVDGELLQTIYHVVLHESLPTTAEIYRRDGGFHPNAADEKTAVIRPDDISPQTLGPWDDTVIRYEGAFSRNLREYSSIEPRFGVDWRNGMARPWANGLPTFNSFAESGLSGTATWNGELVGFTPAKEAVHGDSAISVNLAAMTGNAAFTALERWNAGASPGTPGTGTQWNDGDLHYIIAVDGNYIRSNGGDAGYVSGRFVGARHHGAIGILEHPDLTGAFGAVRK